MPTETRFAPEPIERVQVVSPKGDVDEGLLPDIDDETLVRLYRTMVLSRRYDQARLRLQRQGRIGTFAPAEGQEAAMLGSVAVLRDTDWMVPSYREEVPDDPDHLVPLGATEHVREGDDVTIVCWGAMRYFAEATADVAEREDVAADVYDLRTLSPLDLYPVVASVKRTGRCIVLQEGPRTCGLAAEVAARINEEALWSLEAPVQRVTAPDVHTPLFAREWTHVPTVGRALHGVQQVLRPA